MNFNDQKADSVESAFYIKFAVENFRQNKEELTMVLKNESDYEKASERIEEIYGAKPGTPEKKELEELLKAVKAYEDDFVKFLRDNG